MKSKSQLLSELSQTTTMETGKLCAWSHRPTSTEAGYCRLQCREHGRNVSRHVTAAEAPALREAIAGCQRAKEITEAYLDTVVAETRQRRAGSKKSRQFRSRPGARNVLA